MYKVVVNEAKNTAEVYGEHGKCAGFITDISPEAMAVWYEVEASLPESFGPVYAEHLLEWAGQCGFVVLKPRPSWMMNINGQITSDERLMNLPITAK